MRRGTNTMTFNKIRITRKPTQQVGVASIQIKHQHLSALEMRVVLIEIEIGAPKNKPRRYNRRRG